MRQVANQIGRLISSKKKTKAISNEMVKAVLFESESITKKVLSGLYKKIDANRFIGIAAENGLPRFASQNDLLC